MLPIAEVRCSPAELAELGAVAEKRWGVVIGYLMPSTTAMERARRPSPAPRPRIDCEPQRIAAPPRQPEPPKGDLTQGLAWAQRLGLSATLLQMLAAAEGQG